jgi:ABC-2 type transport system permease protein
MIMRGVMEEKTNRIVELLTSSVKPFQLLMGKIIGVGAVGLTQFILWMILIAIVYMAGIPVLAVVMGGNVPQMGQIKGNEVDPDTLLSFIKNIHQLPLTEMAILFPFYFLGGFLLYGALFAAVGAAVGEDGDQQSLIFPIMIPIIISIIIGGNVINNPDSRLGFWGSLIPFTSPVVMSTLLPFKPVWWQLALSIALLIGGFIFTTYIAGRIYRVGILMYGKKIRMKDLGRWIFAAG